ncbi:alpha/beta-hydrolase [Laetiporus sulphureus 93-53]|uniref:Alpha/beta-hydrolase n=1 Tax=Laetiporus sulphureus 93-53 TaxID=1314785 RepID=A0A165ESE3_9APHY|nr:alpha/beta-hydrolase [Laetiporus sulphureus 93-53]KZT07665.1 alpha/beta-hydrolase [Laetiporus sulphureus 93-53]
MPATEKRISSTPQTEAILDPGLPLLEANRAMIESIERTTHTYGATPAHQLDVYMPPLPNNIAASSASLIKPPILVFFYGGSFIHGSRSLPPLHLAYANVGAYFSSRGIVTVIPDYRLVPDAVYSEGSQDVHDALLWVHEHLCGQADTSRMFVLAHSAGGIHAATMLLTESMFTPPLSESIRGVMLLGVPFEIQNGKMAELWKVAQAYYGSTQKIAKNQPLGLLRGAEAQHIGLIPPLRVALAGSEPRAISSASRNFAELYTRKGGIVETVTLDGHDHLSPILALSSGSGEEWGEDLVTWIWSVTTGQQKDS